MRWDVVLQKVGDAAAGDPLLAGIFGAAIRLAGTSAFTVPALELQLVADSVTELWAPCIVQWDLFTKDRQTATGLEDLRAAERRLRQLFHLDVPATFGGLGMFSQYEDGTMIATPDRDGYYGRAVRFRYTPLRERYDALQVT